MNVLPVDLTAIVAIVLGMMAILIPVAGLTARFALKPVVEAIARMREVRDGQAEAAMLERRMALLEQQFQSLERTLANVVEEAEFRRQLETPRS